MKKILYLSIFLLGNVHSLSAVDHKTNCIWSSDNPSAICTNVCSNYGGWTGTWSNIPNDPTKICTNAVCGCRS